MNQTHAFSCIEKLIHTWKLGGIMDSDSRLLLFGGLTFVTGVLLGTGLGLLLAPQSGRRTRRQLKNYLDDTTDRLNEFADETKDRMSDYVEKGKRFVDDRL